MIAACSSACLRDFSCLSLFSFKFLKLIFELAASNLQPASHLRQQLVAVFDSRSDIAGTVLKFALALKIERVQAEPWRRLRDLFVQSAGWQGSRGFPDS